MIRPAAAWRQSTRRSAGRSAVAWIASGFLPGFLASGILRASSMAGQHRLVNILLADPPAPTSQQAMADEQPLFRITRETLRDGSLIEAARRRMAPDMQVRSDAEIAVCLDTILATHPPDEDVWLF